MSQCLCFDELFIKRDKRKNIRNFVKLAFFQPTESEPTPEKRKVTYLTQNQKKKVFCCVHQKQNCINKFNRDKKKLR